MGTSARQRALTELIEVVEDLRHEFALGRSRSAALLHLPGHRNEVLCARLRGQQVRPEALRPAPLLRHCRARLAARRVQSELASVMVAMDSCRTPLARPAEALGWLTETWRIRGERQ